MRKCCCCHCSRYFQRKEKRATSTLSSWFNKSVWTLSVQPNLLSSKINPDCVILLERVFKNGNSNFMMWLDDESFSSVSATESVEHFQYMFSHLPEENRSDTCVDKTAFLSCYRFTPSPGIAWTIRNLYAIHKYWCKINVFILFQRLSY